MTGKSTDRSTSGEEHESAEDVLETIELGNPNLPADDIDIEAPRVGTTPPSEQSRSGVTDRDSAPENAISLDGADGADSADSAERPTTTAVSPTPAREPPEGGVALPAMQRQITTGSSKPYSAFPISTRWFISALVGVAAIFSPISSNIFVPAIPTLAQAFGKSEQDISLAVTVYLVFQAVTPSFFGSLSDTYGRRPVYIVTLSVYLCANIGLAAMPTTHYWLLLFLRGLQSTGGSAVISIGAGSVADVAEPRERGKFFAIFQLGAMLGPAVGPLIGGVLSSTLGWRSIFWFLVISCAVVLIPLIFVLPETLRSLVGDGSLPPPPLCMSPVMLWHRRQSKKELKARGEEKEHVERPPRKKYDPLSSFKMLLIPEIILTFVFVSLLYLQFYCILVLYSTALKDTYGLNDLKIGLAYLPNGAGVIVSTLINGRQLDWYFKKEEARAGGDYRKKGEEFRIDITRLRCLAPFFLCAICSSVAQGWCLQVKAPLAVTLVLGFFVGLGSGTINTATLYGQDLLPGKGGAVSASLNLVRCLFGAVGTATIQIMYNNVGAGWATVILSGICVAGVPLPLIVCKKASGWRTSRVERKSRKSANLEGR